MMSIVGAKGQITIDKEILHRLGIKPGWLALQRIIGDHVEVYFVPPEHRKSLKGSLAKYVKAPVAPGEEWDKARDRAWKNALDERFS